MTGEIKAAVIGVGRMGENHARVYHEMSGVELVAVVDDNKEIACQTSQKFGTKAYSNARQMLQSEKPDVVSVAVPTHLHHRLATEVIASGCHLLLEKPIADDEQKAERIIAQAKEAKRQLMIGHTERFNPAVQRLRQYILGGELGRMYYLEAHRAGLAPTQAIKSGVTHDLAVHDLDIIHFVTACHVETVSAVTSYMKNNKHEDWMHGTLSLSQNIMASVHCDWLTPVKKRELAVVTENAVFVVDYIKQELTSYKDVVTSDNNIRRDSVSHAIKKREPLVAEIEAFITSIKRNEVSPVTGEDGLEALRVANSILLSAKRRAIVSVSALHKPKHYS